MAPRKKQQKEQVELRSFKNVTNLQSHTEDLKDAANVPSSKICFILSEIKQMKIELIMFIYMFSFFTRSVSVTTLIMDKVCLVHFNLSLNICSNLSFYPSMKSDVVKLANNYQMGYNYLVYLPSSILCCFIGSWSDKYGRKVPMGVAVMGTLLTDIGTTLSATFMHSRVEMLYIGGIFTSISGGFTALITVMFSYVSDISTMSNRTMKFTILQIVGFGLAMPFGLYAGGSIYHHFGYVPVFLVSILGNIIACLLIVFLLKETKGLENKDRWTVKFRNFWSTETVVASFKATMVPRPNHGKKQILLLMLCMTLAALHMTAHGTIGYSFVHHRYGWNNTKFSTVFSIFSGVGTFAILFIVPLFKRLDLGDATLGIVAAFSMFFKDIAFGFASHEYIYYAGKLVGIFEPLLSLACRSRVSKVVSLHDVGKVFAFFSTAEWVFPVIATAAISQIFNASLNIFPGLLFLLLSGLAFIPFGVFLWISGLPKANFDNKGDIPDTMDPVTNPTVEEELPNSRRVTPSCVLTELCDSEKEFPSNGAKSSSSVKESTSSGTKSTSSAT